MRAKLLVVAAVMSALSGCAHNSGSEKAADENSTVMIDGFRLWREAVEDDFKKVKSKAAFDLSCDAGKLELHVLGLMSGAGVDDWAADIGVKGCGQRARYTRAGPVNPMGGMTGNWTLVTKGSQDPQEPNSTTRPDRPESTPSNL